MRRMLLKTRPNIYVKKNWKVCKKVLIKVSIFLCDSHIEEICIDKEELGHSYEMSLEMSNHIKQVNQLLELMYGKRAIGQKKQNYSNIFKI